MRPARCFLKKGDQTLDRVVTHANQWSHGRTRQAELRWEGPEEGHSGKTDGVTEAGVTGGPW